MRSRNRAPASRMVAYIAVMTAMSAVIGYIEMLVPISFFGLPGVKLGLANIVSLIALYVFGPLYAFLIMTVRVILLGFMFGNMYSILYGLMGGFLSITVMLLLKKAGLFTMTGVSAAGGVFHNMGQLCAAGLTFTGLRLYYYIPVLVFSGLVCGCVTGVLSTIIEGRIGEFERQGYK